MKPFDEKMIRQLANLLKARFPYIYISTWEEERALDAIRYLASEESVIRTPREVFVWSQTAGIVDEKGKSIADTQNPLRAIEYIRRSNSNAIFILKDFHVYFGVNNRPPEYGIIRSLRDAIPDIRDSEAKKNVIFISPTLLIPSDMQKEISIFDFPLPGENEIRDKLDEMIEQNEGMKVLLDEQGKQQLAKAALGLTLQEAENAFARAIVDRGQLDDDSLSVIHDEKNQVIKKTGILEFIKSDLNIQDVGGLENMKRWLEKRNNSWLDSAKEYNLPAPKGMLITGVPGCGKSLTAKAVSAMWKLPLLKLDMGRIFSGIVGSSEENMRRAIATAEAVSPSILWVDEIEKGLGGLSGGASGDSGTTTRVFGTFLTWMQEKKAPVFVLATANNIQGLPPELLRKGRFDEIFFVDLPTVSERKEIFKVHLEKRLTSDYLKRDLQVTNMLLSELAEMSEGFVGAEIEQAVITALYEAFFANRPLKKEDLEYAIRNTVPLSVTQKEQIRALRNWANVRAVAATAREDMQDYEKDGDGGNEDINASRGGRTLDF